MSAGLPDEDVDWAEVAQTESTTGELLSERAERILIRLLEDAFWQGRAEYWDKRAETFEWARARPGEFVGRNTTPEERQARDERLARKALNCRRHAALLRDLAADGTPCDQVTDTLESLLQPEAL